MNWKAWLVAAAIAGSGAIAQAETVILTDGKPLTGRILAISNVDVTLELADVPGSRVAIPMTTIEPYSQYELRQLTMKEDSAPAHLELAEFCEDRGMYNLAIVELEKTIERDPARRQDLERRIAALRERASETLFRKAETLLAAGRPSEALKRYRELLEKYPGAAAERRARARVTELAARLERESDREPSWIASGATSDEAGARQRIYNLLSRARVKYTEGLAVGDHLGRQEDLFDESAHLLERARVLALALPQAPPPPPEQTGGTQLVSKEQIVTDVNDQLIEVYVSLGFNAQMRGAYERAYEYASSAMSINPNHPAALDLRLAVASGRPGNR